MPTALPLGTSSPAAGALPLREALQAVQQAAQQVAAWHERGLVHLTIERAALRLNDRQVVRLSPPQGTRTLGGADSAAGLPPEYAGPLPLVLPVEFDAARAALTAVGCPLDPRRIDVYQLGELLCSLVTSEPIERYLQSPRVKGSVPRAVSEVIDHALGFDPTRRYGSASELAEAIDRALAQDSLAADKSSASDTSPRIAGGPRRSDTSTGMLAKPALSTGDLPFQRLGQYEIVARLGSGGMGDVYQGYDADLDRYVAIKVLPAELARSGDFVIRFRSEAAAAAKVEHPNIVPIYTIGTDQGHHFFAMQYVAGQSLAEVLAVQPKPPLETTLAIVEQVVSGLAAAHRHGLVHRDIKPGNILLAEGGRRALVADFGLVKVVAQESRMTATGVIMGTVDYLSPEQGRGKAVDGRSDLYSIGVLLYQMLAGRLPFMADSPTAMIFQHAYEPPPPLTMAAPDVPADLAAVVHRLLAKSPDQRHATCEELLEDLQAIRAGQSPPHAGNAAGKQATAIVTAPQFGAEPAVEETELVAASRWSWSDLYQHNLLWLRRQAPEVVRRLENTQQQVDGAVFEYRQRCESLARLVGEAEEVQRLLSEQVRAHQEAADEAQRRMTDGSAATEAIELATADRHANQCAAQELQTQLTQQQDELDAMRLELAKAKSKLTRLQSQRDALHARLQIAKARYGLAHGRPRSRISPARLLISAAIAVTVLVLIAFGVWSSIGPPNAGPGVPLEKRTASAPAGGIESAKLGKSKVVEATFDDARQQVDLPMPLTTILARQDSDAILRMDAGCEDGSLLSLMVRDGKFMQAPVMQRTAHRRRVTCLAWNFPSRQLASGSEDGEVLIWHANTVSRRLPHGHAVHGLAFSINGQELLTAANEIIHCWNSASGDEVQSFARTSGTARTLVWNPDQTSFLAGMGIHGGPSAAVLQFNGEAKQLLDNARSPIVGAAIVEGGGHIVGAKMDGSITVWESRTGGVVREFGSHIRCAAFAPLGSRVLSGDASGAVNLWDRRTGTKIQEVAKLKGAIDGVGLSDDGDTAVVWQNKTVRVCALPAEVVPGVKRRLRASGEIAWLEFCPTKFEVASASRLHVSRWPLDLRGLGGDEDEGAAPASSVAYTPDGSRLLVARPTPDREGYGPITLREPRTFTSAGNPRVRQFRGHKGGTSAAVFALNGTQVVSGGNDNHLRIWETSTEQELGSIDVGAPVRHLGVTADGLRAVVACDDPALSVWDLETKARVGLLSGHELVSQSLVVARKANIAITASGDRTARVWDLTTLQSIATFKHDAEVSAVAVFPDGQRCVTGSRDGGLRFWNIRSNTPSATIWAHSARVSAIALAPDGRSVVSAGDDTFLSWCDVPSE